jgi:hypothetical protein
MSDYGTSPIKRQRATKAEILARREALYSIVSAGRPMTVRQCFYQASIRGIVEKTEAGYNKVQRTLADMRREGDLPYEWLADNTRWERRPTTFDGVDEALKETARLYRKSLWADAECYVEIWLEKDALAGVVMPITSSYDVPLMVARGYSSLSFLHSAAEYIEDLDVPAHIYHFGDHDPSGVDAARAIEEGIRDLAPFADINFERVAVTPRQIEQWSLPSRPTKRSDSRAKKFGYAESVELDAIDPHQLRDLVESVINIHLPQEQLSVLRVAEDNEREWMRTIAAAYQGGPEA